MSSNLTLITHFFLFALNYGDNNSFRLLMISFLIFFGPNLLFIAQSSVEFPNMCLVASPSIAVDKIGVDVIVVEYIVDPWCGYHLP